MQHLLDFVHEHTLEQQLYFVAHTASGDLELLWQRRSDGEHIWQVRPYRCEGPWEQVHAGDLLEHLEARAADMSAVERELHAMVTTQIAYADMVLRDADEALGRELVERARLGYQQFVAELRQIVDQLSGADGLRSKLSIVPGGGDATSAREGHLTLLR